MNVTESKYNVKSKPKPVKSIYHMCARRKKPSGRDSGLVAFAYSYLVTLKALSSLTDLRTERPMGGMTSHLVSTSSMMDVVTTKQSNLLNSDAL